MEPYRGIDSLFPSSLYMLIYILDPATQVLCKYTCRE